MVTKFLFAVVLFLAAGPALPKMSECDTDCEKTYKFCLSSGKGSDRACLAAREKCRKTCLKKAKAAGPTG